MYAGTGVSAGARLLLAGWGTLTADEEPLTAAEETWRRMDAGAGAAAGGAAAADSKGAWSSRSGRLVRLGSGTRGPFFGVGEAIFCVGEAISRSSWKNLGKQQTVCRKKSLFLLLLLLKMQRGEEKLAPRHHLCKRYPQEQQLSCYD